MYDVRFRPYRYTPPPMTWVGKGSGPLAWVMIASMLAVACLLAWWLH
jgi:hypothetical protein